MRSEIPTNTEVLTSWLIGIGGGYTHYAIPQAVVAGVVALAQGFVQWVRGLANLPPGAQGGFLQPPQSHFTRES